MRRVALIAGAAVALAATPASAARYSGETNAGHPISFKLAGGKVRALDALVPTSCVSTGDDAPRAGAERFQPPGAYAVGATRETSARQDAAMHYDQVTKHYRVTLRGTRGGGLVGKLHVNFSFNTLDMSDPYFGPRLVGWVCQGDDGFRAR